MRRPTLPLAPLAAGLALGLAGAPAQAAPLAVSATNTIVADFVKVVGGPRVSVRVIVPAGADSHTFQPSTGTVRALAQSRVLFANGAGLEPWLPRLRAAAPKVPVRELTAGLNLRPAPGAGGAHAGHDDHAGERDPHAWWDLTLAAGYVRAVQKELTALDPAGRADYASRTERYLGELRAADAKARAELATIPAARRSVVTNHSNLSYLAARYGLKVVGTVLPGLGTEREPSTRELAGLISAVKASGARVILTENTVSPRLAQTLARETGARLAPPLYTDALGPAGSPGDTFLKAFRYNVGVLVRSLKGG